MKGGWNPTAGETGKSFIFRSPVFETGSWTQCFPGCQIVQTNMLTLYDQTFLWLRNKAAKVQSFRGQRLAGGKQTVNLLPFCSPNAGALPCVCHGNGAKPSGELHLKLPDVDPVSSSRCWDAEACTPITVDVWDTLIYRLLFTWRDRWGGGSLTALF